MIEEILLHSPAFCIGVPLLVAFLCPLAEKGGKSASRAFALFGAMVSAALAAVLSFRVFSLGTIVYSMGASSPGIVTPAGFSLPVRIVLEIDAFSALMALLASLVFLCAVVYSISFFREKSLGKLYSLFFLAFAGLLGLFFTGDLFNLFVFFEVLSVSSVGLIAFWHSKKRAAEAAYKYLLVGSIASLFLLFSIALLYSEFGVLNIAAMGALAGNSQISFTSLVALGLLVAAFAMKAGSAPMHFWLPGAYSEAPAPVTALLGIATLSSIYALARILFTLFGFFALLQVVAWALILLGLLSMLVGTTMALKQDDLKRLIAFTAVAQTGFIFVAVGVGLAAFNSVAFNEYGFNALAAGLFHLFNHGLYEAMLFLAAGSVFYSAGKKGLDSLSGLARQMPFTAVVFLLGSLAVAGIPPLNGFASKLLIYETVYRFNPLLAVFALAASVLTLVIFLKAFSAAFLGPEIKGLAKAKEAPKPMLLAMLVLAIAVVLIGLFPGAVLEHLIEPAAAALSNRLAYLGAVM